MIRFARSFGLLKVKELARKDDPEGRAHHVSSLLDDGSVASATVHTTLENVCHPNDHVPHVLTGEFVASALVFRTVAGNAPEDSSTQVSEKRVGRTRTFSTWRLMVTAGLDAGQDFPIAANVPQRILLGTSPACDLRLTDPTVSRRHAALEPTERGLRLTDLSSTNGVFVNGLKVFDALLRGGETITVGSTSLRLEAGASEQIREVPVMGFGKFVGASPEMRALYPLCFRLASSDLPLVIEGETGTGKEVMAEAIHDASPRADHELVVFDCTTVPPNLAESLLFGYEKGAFTGAVSSKAGYFEQAHGGTLLIDEIGELEPALQAKLLRAIERGEVRRVGARRWSRYDVRIVAATRRDLDREVGLGRFRDDLFYRLAVGRIELPPLRRRAGDVELLARHFWTAFSGKPEQPDTAFLQSLVSRDWPGNVRQLRNVVAQRIALGDLFDLESIDLSVQGRSRGHAASDTEPIADVLARELPFPVARRLVLAAFETRYVAQVLANHGGNVGAAAKASGVGRRYFQMIRGRTKEV